MNKPNVWGPPFWFSLHVSAAFYPLQPSDIVKERMKCRILAIPYEVPCDNCRAHASAFIEGNRHRLDEIVGNRHELGRFYVDFHNKVNERYGKPLWTYEQAYSYYGRSV
jgi:FAD-linked sulfhydryl oxidase